MTLTLRRFLYGSTFALFFVASPLLILFALGYRWDLSQGHIVSSGALYVKSYPSDASVLVDGSDTHKRTPARILSLLPGLHAISVAKEGFSTWTKELKIRSKQTTFIRDVVLFKELPTPRQLSPGGAEIVHATRSPLYFHRATSGIVFLTNTTSGKSYSFTAAAQSIRLYDSSPDGSYLLIDSAQGPSIIDVNTDAATRIQPPFSPSAIKKGSWDPVNNGIIWLLSGRQLYRYDMFNKSLERSHSPIRDFWVTTDSIYTLESETSGGMVRRYDKVSGSQLAEMRLPFQDELHFEASHSDDILMLTAPRRILIVKADISSYRTFDAVQWDLNYGQLLYSTDFEVYVYTPSNDTIRLIDRTSERIEMVRWHPSTSYFLRWVAGKVELVELDERDHRNITTILTINRQFKPIFDQKGSSLFILNDTENLLYRIQ